MPAAFGANPDAEDEPEPNPIQGLRQEGRADQQPPRDFRRIEQKVKEETAAQLRKEFGEKIFSVSSADNMELLAFMVEDTRMRRLLNVLYCSTQLCLDEVRKAAIAELDGMRESDRKSTRLNSSHLGISY